jgi:hypothetical protein
MDCYPHQPGRFEHWTPRSICSASKTKEESAEVDGKKLKEKERFWASGFWEEDRR